MEEKNSWIETISSPWREALMSALRKVQQKLFLVSPYIKKEIVQQIQEAILLRDSSLPIEIHIITRSLPEEFISGSSDVEALQQISKWSREIKGCRTEIRVINNVHAKIWIFDSQLAIVGSGNATPSGLDTNIEYELAITHPQTIGNIQQDWQPLWEYAELVTETQLTTMAEWVRQIQTASISLEQETKKQRQAIEKKIGEAPKLGKKYTVKPTKHVVAKPSPESNLIPQYPIPSVQRTKHVVESPSLFDEPRDSALPPGTIRAISIKQFQQALVWIFPRIDDWTTDPSSTERLFLKITWISQSTTQYLQLNWADGKRLSQATITGQSIDTTQSWSMSTHFQQIATLVELLQKIQISQNKVQYINKEINILLSTEGMTRQLYISEPDCTFNMQTPALTGTQTNMPLLFSTLKQSVSSIIIEHSQLIAMLHQLEQQWYSLHEEQKNRAYKLGLDTEVFNKQKYRPTTLNLRLDTPGERSYIQFSLESSNVRSEIKLLGTLCVLVGPAIVITLDYKALWQALIGTQNAINTWKLCIDANVNSLQLIPESTKDNALSHWHHELLHVGA